MGTARTKANNKWNAKAYDRVNLTMPKGRKAEIQAYAEAHGESVNAFINRAINEAMERDSSGPEKQ
ncbi:Arc family DNA-binding protein [Fournierella sp.]|uniref:Arc family DNA-binding protein n=1 Tax=Allofournierella sp. TaxID=1940256 RepID=UPI0025C15397|nr:Arc family DNA-binding protein [Fournierella sp.]